MRNFTNIAPNKPRCWLCNDDLAYDEIALKFRFISEDEFFFRICSFTVLTAPAFSCRWVILYEERGRCSWSD